ncbi:MAG: phosphoenolpyruvate carboxylase [Inquilinaceae bacterium]
MARAHHDRKSRTARPDAMADGDARTVARSFGEGPFVPADAPCFGSSDDADPTGLMETLTDSLRRFTAEQAHNPLDNPIQRLALDISDGLRDGSLTYAAIEQLVQYLTADGFVERARRLGRYMGEMDPARNEACLRETFHALAQPRSNGELGNDRPDLVRFEVFRRRVEQESFGVVFTAHPTFSMSGDLMRILAALATGHAADGETLSVAATADLAAKAAHLEHRPDRDMSLAVEHALSLEAIGHAQEALRRAYGILLEVAQTLYPDRWSELTPRLMTLASWVGYDLDGRSDIEWTDTFHKRLKVQRGQLAHYLSEVRDLIQSTQATGRDLRDVLELMESRLVLALTQIDDEIAVFKAKPADEAAAREGIKAISRRMYEGRDLRLTDAAVLIEMVERAVTRTQDESVLRRLCVLRAELSNYGLGMAHTHVRINATQVHNAIRKAVGLVTHPNDPRNRQSYIDTVNGLLDTVEPVHINFGSIMGERTSVKRLFMVVAQMLKYSDSATPIRFLIAECESAFTALTALYFARMFGVEERVDISPLFETEKALEAGSRVVEQLLENPHYRAYVERRGRICVQTGFSDAGRYLGQTPAAASIERLRLRLTRVMAKHALKDVQLLIFDTHGESIGRGAHPASFADRLGYIDTPASRGFMADNGVDFKQEVSVQGGDGFLYFVNRTGAFAVITRILEHALRHGDNSADDPFYDESTYIREFFTTVKEFQVDLMNDRNYGALLSAFGTKLLFPSGSRPQQRQHEDPSEATNAFASQLRAIPHNAVLMQLGLLANSIGGVGAAIAKDPERFRSLYPRSARLRELMGIVEYGAALSAPDVMKAYIATLDPDFWITRAAVCARPDLADRMMRLADQLETGGLYERQMKVFRRLHKDHSILLGALDAMPKGVTTGCGALVSDQTRERLFLLHAVRLAAIHEVFLMALEIPEFSSRHAATPKQIVARLLHLDVPDTVALLEEVFPLLEDTVTLEDFGEPADYASDESQSYRYENERIFRPMLGLYTLIRRVSTAVAHRAGFFG